MLEKAEQRSRALGVANLNKYPLSEFNDTHSGSSAGAGVAQPQLMHKQSQCGSVAKASSSEQINKLQVVEKKIMESPDSSNKILRQFSTVGKENMDLGIEINIVTDKNVEVQVEVEEQEITDEESSKAKLSQCAINEEASQPLAAIRDTSRNRLQRLGALYSNTNDLSSPIHRTEGHFHAGNSDETEMRNSKKPKQRYGKLAALANTINEWEDDIDHPIHHATQTKPEPVVAQPPPKPDLPSRYKSADSLAASTSKTITKQEVFKTEKETKQLKWDPKVIDSLEAQGFQRRESSTIKYAYEYEDRERQTEKINVDKNNKIKDSSATVISAVQGSEEKPEIHNKPQISTVKSGLVSGRAAVFENKLNIHQQQQSAQQQRPQKDPTELSLKERMQLFERNKGQALVPKAAFGMAPPISKIRKDNNFISTQTTKGQHLPNSTESNTRSAPLKQNNNNIRNKVAAFVANVTTIGESRIKEDILKQRQEDMQVLANRFQKPAFGKEQEQEKEQQRPDKTHVLGNKVKTTTEALRNATNAVRPPPPPPPPPLALATATKRRSPSDANNSKRVKESNSGPTNRLYPALSDLESYESVSEDDNCCTTATVSAQNTADEELGRSHRTSETAPLRRNFDEDEDEEDNRYMDSEADDSSVGICNGSLGREVMQAVQRNEVHVQNKQPTKHNKSVHYSGKDSFYGGDSSINSSEASAGVEDYLDEAFDANPDSDGDDDCTQESESDERDSSRHSKGSKGTTTSNSFSFRKTPHKYSSYRSITEENGYVNNSAEETEKPTSIIPPVKSELSINQEDNNMVTLVHTVSFYRKQQSTNSANSTPVRRICREQQVLRSALQKATIGAFQSDTFSYKQEQEPTDYNIADLSNTESDFDTQSSDMENEEEFCLVQEKIKRLLDEVCKQQQIIGQTSQALNLCAATIEFSGSTESVEGERHLLVATHRRQACLDEVQRLRVEKTLRPVGAPKEKGVLTVKEITVPLRQDYIRKLASETISGHHLVCLLKYNEHVVATRTVPTLPGLLAVKFPDVLQLNNVYADFRVTLEIYGMTAQREVLPHEVKYHINLNKKSGIKTPKKKGSDNRLIMPPVQSPAGPNAVRTPALVQYGFAIFSLREIQRTSWTLTQVLGVCPLDGVVHMKVNCELSVSVSYKGFLTMFEEISGFGAWHRRWCHLNGTMLNFWKYPDDEKRKPPMGSIDLYTCSTKKVSTAPRDICARLNTLLLECQRPVRDSDQESLIILPNGLTTTVRYLLSADTKEEREEWCAYFNKALTLLRAWGPPQST